MNPTRYQSESRLVTQRWRKIEPCLASKAAVISTTWQRKKWETPVIGFHFNSRWKYENVIEQKMPVLCISLAACRTARCINTALQRHSSSNPWSSRGWHYLQYTWSENWSIWSSDTMSKAFIKCRIRMSRVNRVALHFPPAESRFTCVSAAIDWSILPR